MKKAMVLFGVTLGKRYSRKQKNYFYFVMKKEWERLGYAVNLQSFKSKLYRHYNIVIGNLDTAKTLVICGYDTPMKGIRRKTCYYPFHSYLNKQNAKRNLVYQVGFSLALLVFIILLWKWKGMSSSLQLPYLLIIIILLALAYYMLKGRANPVNFNRNSASLALLSLLMEEHIPQVGYVLLDQSIDSFEGIKLLKEYMNNQKIICLDCIAEGRTFVIAHEECMKKEAKKLLQAIEPITAIDRCYYKERPAQNSISIIPSMLYVVSGEIIEKEFVVKNTGTKADMQVDVKRLEQLQKGISRYLKGAL